MANTVNSNSILNNNSNQILSDHRFESPLKRKRDEGDRRIASKVVVNKRLHLDSFSSLVTCYSHLNPALQAVAKQIEDFLTAKQCDGNEFLRIRSQILKMSGHANWSLEKKYAELGVLYFYVTSGKQLPQEESLVQARLTEISQEVTELKKQHQQICEQRGKENLASGYVIYIQRALVRMVMTSQGDFNLAGCFAVQELLRSSLSLFMTEEHREQILGVVSRLIEDPQFRNRLQNKFTVHPDMEKWIFIDMKLPRTEKLEFIYVQWDMLIALFSVTGQQNEGNCYAFASLSYLMRHHPKELLEMMIETLQTGKFTFNGLSVPIFTIFDCSKKFATDFQTQMSVGKATQLTSYAVACSAMGIEPWQQENNAQLVSISALLERTFGNDVGYAKEIILSHKQNVLQQMVLSILHFVIINAPEKQLFNTIKILSPKTVFCEQLFISLNDEFKKIYPPEVLQSQEYITFYSAFCTACLQHLFLADFVNGKTVLKNNRISFEFHSQGFMAHGAVADYLPFMKMRRLYFSKQGDLFPVDKLSSLVGYLVELAHASIAKDSQIERSPFFLHFIDYLLSTECMQIMAQLMVKCNAPEINFDWKRYHQADSCIMVSNGGDARLFFSRFPANRFSHVQVCSAKDPFTFFTEICRRTFEYATCNPKFNLRGDSLLLISTDDHVFLLTPEHFKKYWSSPASIESTISTPGKNLLNKCLTEAQQKRILAQFLTEKDVEIVCALISYGEISAREFGMAVRKIITTKTHSLFNIALEQVICALPASTVESSLPPILVALDLHMDLHTTASIFSAIEPQKQEEFFTPYELALKLRKALITYNAILPLQRIENAIRSFHGFPAIIDLGNINCLEKDEADKCIYQRLALQFDFVSETLELRLRSKGESYFLANGFVEALYKPFDLFF